VTPLWQGYATFFFFPDDLECLIAVVIHITIQLLHRKHRGALALGPPQKKGLNMMQTMIRAPPLTWAGRGVNLERSSLQSGPS
jgi:hypothetical protein